MSEQIGQCVYTWRNCGVDQRTRQLSVDGAVQQLNPRAFDVLLFLLERAGEVVTKDEILAAVWPDAFVEENNLTQQISAIRKAVGDSAREHKHIATIPGRGYCFVAPVRSTAVSTAEFRLSPETVRAVPNRRYLFDPGSMRGTGIAAAYVFIVFFAVFVFDGRGQYKHRPFRSVGILSFKSVGAADERLGVGIRDTLRAKLGSLEDLNIRPGGFDDPRLDSLALGRQMNVDVVLSGSVQKEQDRIRVTVEMVDVSNERVVWGRTFDENAANVFALQDTIASEVVRTLLTPRLSSATIRDRNDQVLSRHMLLSEAS